jgi:hypothetical protein
VDLEVKWKSFMKCRDISLPIHRFSLPSNEFGDRFRQSEAEIWPRDR